MLEVEPKSAVRATATAERAGWAGDQSTLPDEPRVSVVIPALNEADNIPAVLAAIPSWVHEVVLVDGRSTDGTPDVARRAWPNHHIVVKERRQRQDRRRAPRPDAVDRRGEGMALRIVGQTARGKGNALKMGYAATTGEIIIHLDADGSTDPREIGRFVETLKAGADYAKGTRFRNGGGTDDMPFHRKIGNGALTMLTNILFGTRYTDITYGYNAFWRRHAGALALEIDGWANEIVGNIRVARHGLRVVEVPSFEHPRLAGEAKLQGVYQVGWKILRAIIAERFQSLRPRATLPSLAEIPTVLHATVDAHTVTLRPEVDGPTVVTV